MSPLSRKADSLVRGARRAYLPSAADRERLLEVLRSKLGESALPSDLGQSGQVGSVGHAATVASASRTIWWLMSTVAVGVGIIGGGLFLARGSRMAQSQPPKSVVVPLVAKAPASDYQATPTAEPPSNAAEAASAPGTASPLAATVRRPKDRLAAEVAILSRATHDLRESRPAEALKALDEYRRKFPKGMLSEEQRAARVQALCALGRFGEANAQLAGLPPESPLAAQARRFCDATSSR